MRRPAGMVPEQPGMGKRNAAPKDGARLGVELRGGLVLEMERAGYRQGIGGKSPRSGSAHA